MTSTNNKILPVALVAALLGGTVGAFVMRPSKSAAPVEATQTAPLTKSSVAAADQSAETAKANSQDQLLENELASETSRMSAQEKAAFRDGFIEGVRLSRDNEVQPAAATTRTVNRAAPATRVVHRNTRSRNVRRQAPRQVYYDYGERRGRSFWQKHRDKLTVAIGTGAGAAIGGAVGGKKGALIGGLAGAGGSALYTYKLRKKDRRY